MSLKAELFFLIQFRGKFMESIWYVVNLEQTFPGKKHHSFLKTSVRVF